MARSSFPRTSSDLVLTIEHVSKRFGNVRALSDVTCSFEPGEVHAVLGENGAGKSTLMGVLAGFIVPDSGAVEFADESRPFPFGRPHAVQSLGIAMVHQHFMLVPEFTAAENFALGTLDSGGGRLDLARVSQRLREICGELGWELDADAKVGTLPVGVQQRLEIAKALALDARVVILDEPTAVLSPSEVADLFRVVRRLKAEGRTVVLIAHKLSEVLSVADRVTVLRRGAVVASARVAETDAPTLATWMVGEVPAPRSPSVSADREVLMSCKELWVKGNKGEDAVRGVTFDIVRGQVLGIGGVDGNGQRELAEAIVGLRALASGSTEWKAPGRTGYVPADRQREGLALAMSLLDNVLIGDTTVWKGPFLKRSALRSHANKLVNDFEIKAGSLNDPAASLSGGNQQKLVVARALSARPDLFVVSNPTRGLDIRSTAYVQRRIVQAANEGAAVVVFSTDLDELAAVANRTLLMNRGELREGGSEAMVG